ncbi:MAG: 3-hydroxyacyl-ACP dehydratase FabZ family protein [Planctomycetota bacterium]|nr:3-hydroxyacyl-ACP dehydratase FabZ family protein [Planctomycetota bacterium]
MEIPDIREAIPHRPPMLLVDKVVERTEKRIVCEKTFQQGEFFFQGHYPEKPLVPGVILCESAMQAGAILLSQFVNGNSGVPVATRMNDVKFRRMVHPNDTVELTVELKERLADAFFLQARVLLQGKVAVRFDFACTVTS